MAGHDNESDSEGEDIGTTPEISLAEACQLQLTELEMMKSMFPNEDELRLMEPSAVEEMQGVVDGWLNQKPTQLEYIVTLTFDRGKLDVSIRLPSTYPAIEPDVYVRSERLDRQQSKDINQHLTAHIQTFESGQLYVGLVISWLQDNANDYMLAKEAQPTTNPTQQISPDLSRLWIHSHHIYSRTKRRDMLQLAREFQLSGFCLPGKPGAICVEGTPEDVADWWRRVKSWTWKRICVRREETLKASGGEPVVRLFGSYHELDITPPGRLAKFLDFLREHKCERAFRDFFGMDASHVQSLEADQL